jgi:hypothetical protein
MICEFLPPEYKKKLMEVASNEDLLRAGYKRNSVPIIRKLGIMSDQRCDKLVEVLGEKAIPIIEEAIREFENRLNELKRKFKNNNPNVGSPQS